MLDDQIICEYLLEQAIEDGVLVELCKDRWKELSGGGERRSSGEDPRQKASCTALEAGYGREDPRDGFRASMTGRGSSGIFWAAFLVGRGRRRDGDPVPAMTLAEAAAALGGDARRLAAQG